MWSDTDGAEAGTVDAVELVTIGQRKGLGVSGEAEPRYAVAVDIGTATVTIGRRSELFCDASPVEAVAWVGTAESGPVQVQTSAHGATSAGRVTVDSDGAHGVEWVQPHRRVAPGQALVFYVDDVVIGSATAA